VALLRVAIVDDLEINQLGTKGIIERLDGVEVVFVGDFEEAFARPTWDDVDWLLIDVAQEDAESETTPAIPVIEKVRAMSPDPRHPMMVALTSNPIAFNRGLVRRRLMEADADVGLVWRKDLERHIRAAVGATGLDTALVAIPPVDAPEEIPQLGIDADTKVNRLIEGGRELLAHPVKGRQQERRTLVDRVRLAARTGLNARTTNGDPPAASNVPAITQFKRIERESQVSEERESPETRGHGWSRRR
jgi:CheY-like chemotaxis protein